MLRSVYLNRLCKSTFPSTPLTTLDGLELDVQTLAKERHVAVVLVASSALASTEACILHAMDILYPSTANAAGILPASMAPTLPPQQHDQVGNLPPAPGSPKADQISTSATACPDPEFVSEICHKRDLLLLVVVAGPTEDRAKVVEFMKNVQAKLPPPPKIVRSPEETRRRGSSTTSSLYHHMMPIVFDEDGNLWESLYEENFYSQVTTTPSSLSRAELETTADSSLPQDTRSTIPPAPPFVNRATTQRHAKILKSVCFTLNADLSIGPDRGNETDWLSGKSSGFVHDLRADIDIASQLSSWCLNYRKGVENFAIRLFQWGRVLPFTLKKRVSLQMLHDPSSFKVRDGNVCIVGPLPKDLFLHMITFCDINDLRSCMRVCRTWKPVCLQIVRCRMSVLRKILNFSFAVNESHPVIRTLSMAGRNRRIRRTSSARCLEYLSSQVVSALFASGEAYRAINGASDAFKTAIQAIFDAGVATNYIHLGASPNTSPSTGARSLQTSQHRLQASAQNNALKIHANKLSETTKSLSPSQRAALATSAGKLEQVARFTISFLGVASCQDATTCGEGSYIDKYQLKLLQWKALINVCIIYLMLGQVEHVRDHVDGILQLEELPPLATCFALYVKGIVLLQLKRWYDATKEIALCRQKLEFLYAAISADHDISEVSEPSHINLRTFQKNEEVVSYMPTLAGLICPLEVASKEMGSQEADDQYEQWVVGLMACLEIRTGEMKSVRNRRKRLSHKFKQLSQRS